MASPQSISNSSCPDLIATVVLGLPGCTRHEEHVPEGSGHPVLSPLSPSGQPLRQRQVVYVPVYSGIYWGFGRQLTDLAATLSIRNVSEKASIAVHAVKYYDSHGKLVRAHINEPGLLAPPAAADFVIQRRDTAGGPGANFLVEWSSVADECRHLLHQPGEAAAQGQFCSQGCPVMARGGRP